MMTSKSDIDHWQINAMVYNDRVEEIHYITDSARNIRRRPQTKVWNIERLLGRGSFGEVHLQKNVEDGKVRAVKRIVKLSTDPRNDEYEKELKALLEFSKPKSREAAVFVDFFGWFKDGSNVFLAMEYVPLGDLEKNVKAHSGKIPEIEARDITHQILLGLEIMHAESFAHRDLKPQNILVIHGPPEWWVKLADFGLSKRLTELTAYRTKSGTQSYMAPEILNYLDTPSEEYTNAVDLWAVGCITYRLVTGVVPFPPGKSLLKYCEDKSLFPYDALLDSGIKSICSNFIKGLLETGPKQRPSSSQALNHAWINSGSNARKRSEHLLHRTLETSRISDISASPTVYNTITHDGLKSHHLPPPQRTESSYLKSSSRTSFVSDSNLSAVSNPLILTSRPLAMSNLEPTAKQLSTAEEAKPSMLHSDLLANPLSTNESLATPQLALNGTSSLLDSRTVAFSPDRKLVTSLTQDKTAKTVWRYQLQGKYTEAEAIHRQTPQLQETVLGKDHPDTLQSMRNLAISLYHQGKYAEAEKMHWQTLELQETVLGKDHPDTLRSMMNVAISIRKQGKYIEAETMHRQTLQLQETVLGKDHPDTLQSMINVAISICEQGKYAEAETIYRQTLQLQETVLGKDHPDTLYSMMNVAVSIDKQGKYTEAEMMQRQTLQLQETVLGKDHPDTLRSMSSLATSLRQQGKYAEAEAIGRQTLQLREAVLGKDHPDTLRSMNNLAVSIRVQGKYAEAEMMHRQTLQLQETVLGKDHPDTLHSIINVAVSIDEQGKYAESETMYRQTLQLQETVLGKDHPDTLSSMMNVAISLDLQGKYIEAETMYRQTLQLQEAVLGEDHPDTLRSINNLAGLLSDQGKHAEAETMDRHTLQLREKVLGKDHPDTLQSMNNLASLLHRHGKYAEAETIHRQTLQLQEAVLGEDHPETLRSMSSLAGLLSDQGKHAEAETMDRQTLQLREAVLGKDHPDTLRSMNNLASLLHRQGKYAEAETMHRHTLQLREKVLGKDHPDTIRSMNSLASSRASLQNYFHRPAKAVRGKERGRKERESDTTQKHLNRR